MQRLLQTLLVLAVATPFSGCISNGGRIAFLEENDVFNVGEGRSTDKDYTQGSILAGTLPEHDTPEAVRELMDRLPVFGDGGRRHLGVMIGQEIHTPANIDATHLIPDDRPYAGWLYQGVAFQSPVLDPDAAVRGDRVDTLTVALGVVGPRSFAEEAQNNTHGLLGIDKAKGWKHQIDNEPGLLLSWDRRHRVLFQPLGHDWALDGIAGGLLRVGNVHTDLQVEQALRLGWNLPRNFGEDPIDSWGLVADEDPGDFAAWLFGGASARGVGWNAFLDGNTFGSSHSVTRRLLVLEAFVGATARWRSFAISFTQNLRTPDFRERERNHRYAAFQASWTVWF